MRKVFFILKWLLIILFLAILLVVLNDIRIKKSTNDAVTQKNIRVSHKSGFYPKPFRLKLSTNDGNTIRYTFDGNNPTNKSYKYITPIPINGKEHNDSLSYINTTIPDSIYNFGWRIPLGIQDKATILKYAVFKNEKCISDIGTLTFIIDNTIYNGAESLNNIIKKILLKINSNTLSNLFLSDSTLENKYRLPIISISTNKENLFSHEKGLFVSGNKFKNSNINSGNYFERGKNYEREVYLQYFTDKGELSSELNIGMRIHGGITRRNPQKSLKFYCREEYGKDRIHLTSLNNKSVKRFILESLQESGGGQALIEDVVAQEIVRDINIERQRCQPVIVFINGEYWGMHNIRDRMDEDYLSYVFDLHKDSFDLIDGNPTVGYKAIHGSNADYIKIIDFVKKNKLDNSINYNLLCKEIDIENFIDYYSIEIFFANHDWPVHNIKVYRKKDGKWRFLLYDLDGGFTNKRDHSYNMFERISIEDKYPNPEATILFRSLMRNKTFRDQFISRYKEILSLYMQPERTIPIVDSISNVYRMNMQSHVNRWRYPWTINHWERDINKNIKDFLENREKSTLENLDKIIKDKNF